MSILGILFNPNGRIQANQFWRGIIVLVGLGIVFSVMTASGSAMLSGISGILGLLMFYPYLCVFGKRLHDSGRTAWWSVLAFVAFFVVYTIMTSFAFPMVEGYSELQAEMQEDLVENGLDLAVITEYAQKTSVLVFWPATILNTVATVIISFFVARLFSDPYPNKYGPPVGGVVEEDDSNDIFS